jgi:hypothetical protein
MPSHRAVILFSLLAIVVYLITSKRSEKLSGIPVAPTTYTRSSVQGSKKYSGTQQSGVLCPTGYTNVLGFFCYKNCNIGEIAQGISCLKCPESNPIMAGGKCYKQ